MMPHRLCVGIDCRDRINADHNGLVELRADGFRRLRARNDFESGNTWSDAIEITASEELHIGWKWWLWCIAGYFELNEAFSCAQLFLMRVPSPIRLFGTIRDADGHARTRTVPHECCERARCRRS